MMLTVTANPTIDRVYFLDNFKLGEVHRGFKFTRSAGGKGINVARVAKIIGAEVAAMGFVGGYTGEFIKAEVEAQGIKNLFTEIKGETRTCVNISDKSGKSGEILEPGPEISKDEEERFIEDYKNNIDSYNLICVSGSLPKGLDSSFYIKLTEIANKKEKKIIVDTSGRALKDVLKAKLYMVKPNSDELSELLGKEIKTDEEIKYALDFLFKNGIKIPFLTLGKDGGATLYNGQYYRFQPPKVEVVNAVGSGDSVIAGISAGLDMGYDVIDAIKLGMAAGTANTQFCETGIVTKELVDEFYSQIVVKKI